MFRNKNKNLKILTFIIGVFLLARFILNLSLVFLPLNLFFVSSYVLLFALFWRKSLWFLPIVAVFLSVDSMFGTYFFAIGKIGAIEYFGTMAVNLGIILAAIFWERLSFNLIK